MSTMTHEQQGIIGHDSGALLVVAAPGSGKTAVLCERFGELMRKGVNPQKIFCLTFTRTAAQEMVGRVARLGRIDYSLLWPQICTYHALGLRILQRESREGNLSFTLDEKRPVAREGKQKRMIENALRPGIDYATARRYIALNKRRFIGPQQALIAAKDHREKTLANIYAEYERQLHQEGMLDYDSMISETCQLFGARPDILAKYQDRCEHIQVDEFQDTSPAQQAFSVLLGAKVKSFVAVGDPNQSIYGFAGANPRGMETFGQAFPGHKVAYLSHNWRSTKSIVDLYSKAINQTSGVLGGPGRPHTTGRGDGKVPVVAAFKSPGEEAAWILEQVAVRSSKKSGRYGDFAILARTNRQLREMEDRCVRAGIPYKSPGCGFYGRTEVRLPIAFLRMLDNPNATETVRCECRRGDCGQCTDGLRDVWIAQRIARSGLDCARYIVPKVIVSIEQSVARNSSKMFDEMAAFTDPRKNVERAVKNLHYLISGLKEECASLPLSKQVELIYERTGYLDWLKHNEELDEGDNSRTENALELVNAAKAFESREAFLEFIASTDDAPRRQDGATRRLDAVTLSTVHQAKGKEWNVVFVAGLTDGLFPHKDGDPAEENRLLYVALSRAKDELYLTEYGKPAPFLEQELAEFDALKKKDGKLAPEELGILASKLAHP